jgi:hypothetical protein
VEQRSANLTTRFNDFLFAAIGVDANGTDLSVLSALARINVDPWDEATRLAAMPKSTAVKALGSALALTTGKTWKTSEVQVTAARLVELLPRQSELAVAKVGVSAHPTVYWWVWVGFAIAMSLHSPSHQATPPLQDQSTAPSSETAAKNGGAITTGPGDVGQSR